MAAWLPAPLPALWTQSARCTANFSTCPIGLTATDTFIDTLRKVAGVSVPEAINTERGQLLDIITDMHQYFYGKKVGLVGDPDQLISLTEFLVSIDMWPIYVVTGTEGKSLRHGSKRSRRMFRTK